MTGSGRATEYASRPVLGRLADALERHRRRTLLAAWLRATSLSVGIQFALLPALAWISAAHPLEPFWIRALLASYAVHAWIPIALFAAWRRGELNLLRLAGELDRNNPGLPDMFRTVLSLGNHRAETLEALEAHYGEMEASLRVPNPVILGASRRNLLLAGFAFGAAVTFLSGRPDEIALRMLRPVSAWNHRPIPRLEPVGIPRRVAVGDTLRIRLELLRLPASEPVYARIRSGNREFRFPLERRADTAWFRHGPVAGDVAFRFSATGVETPEYLVRAAIPPHPRNLSAIVTPPAYARLPAETLTAVPASFAALGGSRISWSLETSEPATAEAILNEHGAAPETLRLGTGSHFAIRRTVKKAVALRLRFVSVSEDSAAGRAGPYHLDISPDASPEISLLAPVSGQNLGRALKVPVLFRARDDFAVARVRLFHSVFGDGLKSQGDTDVTAWLQPGGMGGGVWDLGGLDLYPGNTVEMRLEVEDNDAVSGPKKAHSETVRLHMPSLEEILAEVEAEEQDAATSLRSAAERGEKMRRELGKSGHSGKEGPPPLGEWEVERILSAAPRQHLQRLRRHLDMETARAGASPLGRPLRAMAREAGEMEKRLPSPGATRLPLAEQKQKLEELTRDQEQLLRGLSALPPPSPVEAGTDRPAAERARLGEELQRNIREQKDLDAWFREREREAAENRERMEETARAEERMREDVRQALDKMQSAMEKALENGMLSPDLMEKMDRIRDLLKEALPDSTLRQLQREAESQPVGLDEMQRSLGEMLERGEGMREGLDRAIRMLEMMRDLRSLEELSRAYRALETEERALRDRFSQGGAEEGQSRQADLRRRLEKKLEEQERMAGRRGFEALRRQTGGRDAALSMRAAENSAGAKDKESAARNAEAAASSLGKAAEEMDDFLQRMQGGPDPSEIAILVDETLEYARWLELIEDREARANAGWWEEDAALHRRIVQATQWLRGRLEKLAARRPFQSEALRREAGALGLHAESGSGFHASLDSLSLHARRAARELLKWMEAARQEESGGSGSGTGSQAGGSGGGSGGEGLSGRLRGISGKQMAVNQATQELLRSFLQSRRPEASGGGENGSAEGAGAAGGSTPGSSGKSGAPGAQQEIGEALERMAESEGDAGGAARKLRQLAEEARGLENALRGRRDAEEMRRRQERFQARLLEAATALEERGKEKRREAEAFRGLLRAPADGTEPSREGFFRELKRRRAQVRGLGLPAEQRLHLEWYYEDLLTR